VRETRRGSSWGCPSDSAAGKPTNNHRATAIFKTRRAIAILNNASSMLILKNHSSINDSLGLLTHLQVLLDAHERLLVQFQVRPALIGVGLYGILGTYLQNKGHAFTE
jgi:hypothetical protein